MDINGLSGTYLQINSRLAPNEPTLQSQRDLIDLSSLGIVGATLQARSSGELAVVNEIVTGCRIVSSWLSFPTLTYECPLVHRQRLAIANQRGETPRMDL